MISTFLHRARWTLMVILIRVALRLVEDDEIELLRAFQSLSRAMLRASKRPPTW